MIKLFPTKLGVTFCQLRCLCQASPAARKHATHEDKKQMKKIKSFCTPNLSETDIENLQSVVGLNIGPSFVGWAKLEKHENTITDLGYHPLPNTLNRMNLNELYSVACDTFHLFPRADHYIFESLPKTVGGNGGRIQLTHQSARLQLTALLVALCNSDRKIASKDKQLATIFLKQNLHGRLYGLLLGNEIVSSLRTVKLILDGNSSEKYTPVKCSSQVLLRYKNSRELEKEFIGRALLMGLTFMELMVYQNPGCMEILNFADKFLPHTD